MTSFFSNILLKKIMEDGIVTDKEIEGQKGRVITLLKKYQQNSRREQIDQVREIQAEISVIVGSGKSSCESAIAIFMLSTNMPKIFSTIIAPPYFLTLLSVGIGQNRLQLAKFSLLLLSLLAKNCIFAIRIHYIFLYKTLQ